ncbi:rRNA maturation RNase YbeY [Planctomycetota bacterium]|nr:rRNA maturation RNase YbeY [Planctomycetota bacterium]
MNTTPANSTSPIVDASSESASDDDSAPPQSAPDPLPQSSPDNPLADFELHISREADDCAPSTDGWLEPMIRKALIAADVTTGSLGINIVHDDRMADLHMQFMNIPGTTDVLTFDMRDDTADPFEGDIVICIDEAARQAEAHKHDTRTELLLYAVHGILHLLGYDDHELEDFQTMHKREDEILQAIGIGKVFNLKPDDKPKGYQSNQ